MRITKSETPTASKPHGWLGYGLAGAPEGMEPDCPRNERIVERKDSYGNGNSAKYELFLQKQVYSSGTNLELPVSPTTPTKGEQSENTSKSPNSTTNQQRDTVKELEKEAKEKLLLDKCSDGQTDSDSDDHDDDVDGYDTEEDVKKESNEGVLDTPKKESNDEKKETEEGVNDTPKEESPPEEDIQLTPEDRDELQRAVNTYALWNRWCTLPKKQFVVKLENTEGCPVKVDDASLLPWNYNKTMINVMQMSKITQKANKHKIKADVNYA